MPTTLRCPACSAPLEIPTQHAATSRCPYCGVGVLLSERHQGTQAATNDPHADTIAEVVRILQTGHMIQAVKLYRERFGVGLKEAKDAVDRIAAGQPAGTVPHRPGGKGSMVGYAMMILIVVGGVVMSRSSRRTVEETSAPPAAQTSRDPEGAVDPGPSAPPALADEVLRFGSEGTGAGRFTDARGVAVDGAGRIYVAEYQGGRVQVFDSAGAFVTQWVADPKMPLVDLEADRGGTVYVVQYGRIRRYEGATGTLLGELPRPQRMTSYSDIALALDGTMWAVAGTSQIAHLGRDGAVRRTIDLRQAVGDDASPERVAVAGTGDVYVLDRWTDEVYHLAPDGRFVDRFGGSGDGPESTPSPEGIAIDGRGRVLVSDLGRGIRVFDASGHYVGEFGGQEVVFGLAVNDRDEVFAAFRNRYQVVKFRLAR
jgi:DNA-binding beta-propeller fold protein YncE/DNA-directed RNA polymerase subunit RPC12/RpoP